MNEKRFIEGMYKSMIKEFNPKAIKSKNDVFDYFFKCGKWGNNFLGGTNDKERTLHENIFSYLYPHFKPQVVFGTGKGGHKKYLSKKFTVDFLDEENNIAVEIDGKNHTNELQKSKDRIKEIFLFLEHGIKTIRFTNEDVERMLYKRIQSRVRNKKYDSL